MIRLAEAAAGTLRSALPPGRDAAAWHAALSAEVAQHLSPAHAALLARPEPAGGGMAWVADGASATRYADLSAADRRALDAAAGAILSDVRRLAESGVAPAVREAWPALRRVPDAGHLHAVDGRPVLSAWGHHDPGEAGGVGWGRLARLDDGAPWRASPPRPWRRYAAMLGVLGALALLAGLLLPLAAPVLVPRPAACAIVPGQLDAMHQQAAVEARGQELQTLLATLTEETGRRQLLCPVPGAPPAAPPPAAAPRADLPQDRWTRRDLSMLEGCWSLRTGMAVSDESGTHSSDIHTWTQCFDGHGAGQQTVVVEDGRRCEGPLSAAFGEGGVLRVTEPASCAGTLHLNRSERLCRRLGDAEAECDGRMVEGNLPGHIYHGRFRR